jgi:hypothetical protein
MPIDSKIIYGNNIISNVSHTKFIGLVIDNILAWSNHIEEIVSKLWSVCCMLRPVQPYMSHSSLIMMYHTLFPLLCNIIIYFGETHLTVRNSLNCKKSN